jgi:hypothetical protein
MGGASVGSPGAARPLKLAGGNGWGTYSYLIGGTKRLAHEFDFWKNEVGGRKMLVDPRQFAHEASLRERRSRRYVFVTSTMILVVAFGFIWLTW